jgi:hypothetical protein
MSIAMDEANSRGFEAGLLFCLGQLEKVYRLVTNKQLG